MDSSLRRRLPAPPARGLAAATLLALTGCQGMPPTGNDLAAPDLLTTADLAVADRADPVDLSASADLAPGANDLALGRDLAGSEGGAGPGCMDGLKNGAETDVDCGGVACTRCADGKLCLQPGDCTSGACVNGRCAAKMKTLRFVSKDLATPKAPNKLAAADLDGDGKVDLAVSQLGDASIAVLRGDGQGGFLAATTWKGGGAAVAAVDLDGDKAIDLVSPTGGAAVAVLRNQGKATFQAAVTYATTSAATALAIGDWNGDQRPDVVALCADEPSANLFSGVGDGTLSSRAVVKLPDNVFSIAAGDLTADQKIDLAFVSASGNSLLLLPGNGDGTFGKPLTLAAGGMSPLYAALDDLNGDGKLDAALTNALSNQVSVLLAKGAGAFAAPTTAAVGNEPAGIVAADFNGDGKRDLAVANGSDGTIGVLLGKGDGSFFAAVTFPAHVQPDALVTADWNGDGKPDLAVVNIASSDLTILINTTQ